MFFDFEERGVPWPDAPKGGMRREIIALGRLLPVFDGWGRPRQGIRPEEAVRLAESLPPPVFDADRPRREADEVETRGERE